MTEIEAIKEFQDNIDLPYGVTVSDEASVMAIKALEKQIPKKPYIQQDNRNNDCLECHFCDSFIGYECDCRDEHYQIDYCPNCGQAIDWS